MLVAFFNVLGEKLRTLGLPFSGIPASTEIIQYLHIPVVFLAAAYVTLDRGHIKIDLISSKFPKSVQKIFNTLGNVCGIIICSFISQRGFILMGRFIARNRMSSVSGVGFPLWPFALILSIGFALLAFSFLWSIVREYAKKDFSLGGNN
jgi:TRAP-type C4-dicarboxylate transport system permease small subunit